MSAFAGVQGYETLSSAQQQERSAADIVNKGFARKPTKTPAHLSRVLHVPAQNNSGFHIKFHDVSAAYKHAIGHAPMGGSHVIGDAPIGSRLFMTRLGTMKTPSADDDGAAQFVADATVGDKEAALKLERVKVQGHHESVAISLPDSSDGFKLKIDRDVDVVPSFPIPDTTSSAGTSKHPFFTFTFSTSEGAKKLQWQTHPLESGPLRYTLVEVNPAAKDSDESSLPNPKDIRAVYHHIGQCPSLSLCNGEGVLLLPSEPEGSVSDDLAVASLLGLLWRVRGMQVNPAGIPASEPSKKSILERIFK